MIPTISLRREWVSNQFFLDDVEITHNQWQKIQNIIATVRRYPSKYLGVADKIEGILRNGKQ